MASTDFRSNGHVNDLRADTHDLKAEYAVLGSMFIDRDAILAVSTVLKASDFYLRKHGQIYRAIMRLFRSRIPADTMTVLDQLRTDGVDESDVDPSYLLELYQSVPTSVHAEYYAGIVHRYSQQRQITQAGYEIAALVENKVTDPQELASQATEILRKAVGDGPDVGWTDMSRAAEIFMTAFDRDDERVLSTGFYDLDHYYLAGGMRGGQLIVIGARTGMGKSAMAVQIIHHIGTKLNRPAGLVSLEMSLTQIVSRMAAIQGNLDMHWMRSLKQSGKITDDQYQQVVTAVGQLSNAPMRILDNRNLTAQRLASRVMQMHAIHGIDCLIVDYLQLMRSVGKTDKRYIEVGDISRTLKGLALELDIPVIALSQLSRESADREPKLQDLRESGNIEQDADIVLFPHRDPDAKQDSVLETKLIIAKHREGQTGSVDMLWSPATTRFLNKSRVEG